MVFAAQVARTPQAVAISCEGRSVTYRELDEAANRVGHLLAGHGAGPGGCVALLMTRSAEAITAILASAQNRGGLPGDRPGAARHADRVPAPPTPPPVAVLTTAGLADRLARADLPVLDVHDPPSISTRHGTAGTRGGYIAYLIYTSGTTGTPKGVAITHRM